MISQCALQPTAPRRSACEAAADASIPFSSDSALAASCALLISTDSAESAVDTGTLAQAAGNMMSWMHCQPGAKKDSVSKRG